MGELCQLDLELAFRAMRPLRENIENKAHPIDDSAVERPLQIALLRPGQGMIEDHDVGTALDAPGGDFGDLAAAGEKRRIRLAPASGNHLRYGCTARERQRLQLVQTFRKIAFAEIDFDQQGAIAAFRTVK